MGLRCPSEVLTRRWNDIDFERGRMCVRSSQLEGQPGEFREMPLFPEVRTALEELIIEPDGAEFVISNQRPGTDSNLRTTLEKIIIKAKVEPWQKPFQNLRASRETELAHLHPVHVVTNWLGNSPQSRDGSRSASPRHRLCQGVSDQPGRSQRCTGAAEHVRNTSHNVARIGSRK